MKNFIRTTALAIILATGLSGCAALLQSVMNVVTLNKSEITLNVDKTYQLTAKVQATTTEYEKVIWSSGDDEIATVDENGLVTGIALGETTIKAAAGFNTATCKVIVNDPNVKIALDKTTLTLRIPTIPTAQLTATVTGTTVKPTWSSSNPEVATVSSEGLVTAVTTNKGTTTITAALGSAKATCKVTVNKLISVSGGKETTLEKK